MFYSCRAARLFTKDETTTSIIEIHSNVERSSLSDMYNPHHLNQFDIYENHNRRRRAGIEQQQQTLEEQQRQLDQHTDRQNELAGLAQSVEGFCQWWPKQDLWPSCSASLRRYHFPSGQSLALISCCFKTSQQNLEELLPWHLPAASP